MRINASFRAMVINTKEQKSQDGSKVYHRMSVDQEGEAGTLGCTEDVSLFVEQFKEYLFTAVYEDKYNSFRVVSAEPVK